MNNIPQNNQAAQEKTYNFRDKIVNKLRELNCSPKDQGQYISARCPNHDDSHPSFAFYPEKGTNGIICFAGCSHESLCTALGITSHDKKNGYTPYLNKGENITGRVIYTNKKDEIITVFKISGEQNPNKPGKRSKRYIAHPKGLSGPWHLLPTYNTNEPIIIPEGEGACFHLRELGFNTTCWKNGAKGAGNVIWPTFQNTVYLWPDNDKAGREAMERAARELLALGVDDLRIVKNLEGEAESADAADYTLKQIETRLENAEKYAPPDEEWLWYVEGSNPWDCTAQADCERTLKMFAADLLVVLRADGATVLVDNGYGVWREDLGEIQRRVSETTKQWAKDAIKADKDKPAVWCMRNANVRGWKNAMDCAAEVVCEWQAKNITPSLLTVCTETELNSNKGFIGAPNGVINTHTGELLTGHQARAKLVSRSIPDAYNPGQTNTDIVKLFDHINKDLCDYLFSALGYSLHGMVSRRIYTILGEPGGGKTTIINAVRASLGEYAFAIHPRAVSKQAMKDGGGIRSEIEMFTQCLIATMDEKQGGEMDVGTLKALSGVSEIGWRQMYKKQANSPSPRSNTATIWMCANEVPEFDLSDPGMLKRHKVIPMPVFETDSEDIHLIERVMHTKDARQFMVALMVEAAANNDQPPKDIPEVKEASEKAWREWLGEAGCWAMDTFKRKKGARLFTSDMFQAAQEDYDLEVGSDAYQDIPFGCRTKAHFMRMICKALKIKSTKVTIIENKSVRYVPDWTFKGERKSDEF